MPESKPLIQRGGLSGLKSKALMLLRPIRRIPFVRQALQMSRALRPLGSRKTSGGPHHLQVRHSNGSRPRISQPTARDKQNPVVVGFVMLRGTYAIAPLGLLIGPW